LYGKSRSEGTFSIAKVATSSLEFVRIHVQHKWQRKNDIVILTSNYIRRGGTLLMIQHEKPKKFARLEGNVYEKQ
jgi:hypothetical protein